MDLGFLSGLLKGERKDNSILSMLLPMLISGKMTASGASGTGDLLSTLLKGDSREKGVEYPPLFGEQKESTNPINKGMLDLLGNVFGSGQKETNAHPAKGKYPYELQYNRPEHSQK